MKNDISSVLWDISEESRDSLPPVFVVRRVLTHGTIGLIIQTISEYGASFVRNVFAHLKSTSFTQKKYLYLKNYLLK